MKPVTVKFRKRYRISDELRNNIEVIMKRTMNDYIISNDEHSGSYIWTNISSGKFHKVVCRARCELLYKKTGIFYFTQEEYDDAFLRTALLAGRDLPVGILMKNGN